jgi:hypothetical protein
MPRADNEKKADKSVNYKIGGLPIVFSFITFLQ